MNADLLKGHLDGMLLAILSEAPAHGYAAIERLRARSAGAFDLAEGTVYPALHRLERDGFLRSHAITVQGRARRVYEVTAAGRRRLGERRAEWRSFAGAVDMVLAVPA